MEQIILVAQKIAKEGKTPTTALVKSRLPKNTPLAAIIQGLKLWKESPEQEVSEPLKEKPVSNDNLPVTGSIDSLVNDLIESKLNAITEPLNQQIANLNQQLTELKQEVKKIKENNNA